MFRNINPFQMHNPHLFQFDNDQTHGTNMHAFGFPSGNQSLSSQMDAMPSEIRESPRESPDNSLAQTAEKPGCDGSQQRPPVQKFRYHVTLNAATAMVKHHNEIPLTYLNKGQTYTVKVQDTGITRTKSCQPTYRTFVRISFEDEEQQRNPAACWQLWKEGRGTNEAHHRGGRLQAVEFAGPSSSTMTDASDKPAIDVQLESFDGFCVVWSPPANGPAECALPVRFNFLSTDFSHSKGVKGIPVRLCTKTELLADGSSKLDSTSEVCYCKVKLFRDHGAERKLSNDVAHVKKLIDKTSQQLTQLEAGVGLNGKRKRSSAGEASRPSKVQRTDEPWSAADKSPISAEDDLQSKLTGLQNMFSSTRASSVLFLKGGPAEDPDAFPVHLPGAMDIIRPASPEKPALSRIDSLVMSATNSPTSSSQSLHRPQSAAGKSHDSRSHSHNSVPEPRSTSHTAIHNNAMQMSNPQNLASPPDQIAKVKTASEGQRDDMSAWIDAIGVDHAYHNSAQPQPPG